MTPWLAGVLGAVAGALIIRLIGWGVTSLPVLEHRMGETEKDVDGLGKKLREELQRMSEEIRSVRVEMRERERQRL